MSRISKQAYGSLDEDRKLDTRYLNCAMLFVWRGSKAKCKILPHPSNRNTASTNTDSSAVKIDNAVLLRLPYYLCRCYDVILIDFPCSSIGSIYHS